MPSGKCIAAFIDEHGFIVKGSIAKIGTTFIGKLKRRRKELGHLEECC
ncbi:MAG: hypothetical protein MUF15_06735 [Acidobacteria bacterium]|jgi:hypothetical protein|nr:hypothetical protein [Acidobacteriota bacterium]